MVETVRKLLGADGFAKFARICIVAATAALPIVGMFFSWYANRLVAIGDRIVSDIADLKTDQKLTQQSIDFIKEKTAAAGKRIEDHEARIRVLELSEKTPPIHARPN